MRWFWCGSLLPVLLSEFWWCFTLCLFIKLLVRFSRCGLLNDHLLGNSCPLVYPFLVFGAGFAFSSCSSLSRYFEGKTEAIILNMSEFIKKLKATKWITGKWSIVRTWTNKPATDCSWEHYIHVRDKEYFAPTKGKNGWLVDLILNVPVNNFQSSLPGCYQYFWEINVSCSRTQHGDPCEDRTPDLSARNPTP